MTLAGDVPLRSDVFTLILSNLEFCFKIRFFGFVIECKNVVTLAGNAPLF